MTFQNSTALVTGGTSGIGRAVAETLAAAGADVTITGRDGDRGAEVVAGIEAAGGTARFISADLASADAVRALADDVGTVDLLVNNAGLFPFAATADLAEADFDATFAVNVKAPFLLTAALAPRMAAAGGGAIVNVSTMVASFGMPGLSAYGASKAALESLTQTWAAEYAGGGVRVNAVAPGPTRTPGTAPMGDGIDEMASTLPVGRAASAQEIADAVVYLASPRATFITGAVLAVDGGRTAV